MIANKFKSPAVQFHLYQIQHKLLNIGIYRYLVSHYLDNLKIRENYMNGPD